MPKHEWIGLMSLSQIKTVTFIERTISAANPDIGDPNETMTRADCRNRTIPNLYISLSGEKQRLHFAGTARSVNSHLAVAEFLFHGAASCAKQTIFIAG